MTGMRRVAWIAVMLLAAGVVGEPSLARARKAESVEELMNPLLSPDYALWLVGPIARIATREEIESYLRATSDEEAREVIDEFWRRRDTAPAYAGNPLRERFEERVAEADRLYSEAGLPGRRTDRGTIFVLYGPPAEERFDIPEHPDDPPLLVWAYPADAGEGLDGKRPERLYRFIKRGDLTTFFTPNRRPPRPRFDRPP